MSVSNVVLPHTNGVLLLSNSAADSLRGINISDPDRGKSRYVLEQRLSIFLMPRIILCENPEPVVKFLPIAWISDHTESKLPNGRKCDHSFKVKSEQNISLDKHRLVTVRNYFLIRAFFYES